MCPTGFLDTIGRMDTKEADMATAGAEAED
jgi:hypothetical protein